MKQDKLVSVVITNYNYGRFLRQAIESALDQTYANREVIVVDDGSADDSRKVIEAFASSVIPVFKTNGGQASAFNAGFAVSRGEIVCFLDADDCYVPETLSQVVPLFADPGVSKVHWPQRVIDEQGRASDALKEPQLPAGDFRDAVRRFGPAACLPSAPTSGNAWARWFLERVMPMPEAAFRLCADAYLFILAPAFGVIGRVAGPNGLFRLHGRNGYQYLSLEEKMGLGMTAYERQVATLERELGKAVGKAEVAAWAANSWWPRIQALLSELDAVLPAGRPFILVDGEDLGFDPWFRGRERLHFTERDGVYWGPPSDDDHAKAELERLREKGASMIVFAWPAFWWLEHYTGFRSHIAARFRRVLANDRVQVYDLQSAA